MLIVVQNRNRVHALVGLVRRMTMRQLHAEVTGVAWSVPVSNGNIEYAKIE